MGKQPQCQCPICGAWKKREDPCRCWRIEKGAIVPIDAAINYKSEEWQREASYE